MGREALQRFLFFTVWLMLSGCTAVKVELEEYPDQLIDRKSFSTVQAADVQNLGKTPKRALVPGSALFLAKVEEPKINRDKTVVVERNSDYEATAVELFQFGWPEARTKIKNSPLFAGQDVAETMDNGMTIHDIKGYMKKAQDEHKTYLAIVTMREHISAPQSEFHNALKAATLNLYDFLPFFKYNLAPFRVSYSSIWEFALIRLDKQKVVFNANGMSTVTAFDRGHDPIFPDEELYKRIAVKEGADKLAEKFMKRLEYFMPGQKSVH